MGIADKLKRAVSRLDDWYSTAIGLGGVGDKVASVAFRHGDALSDDELDALYHRDGIGARIVEAVPSEALREGFRVNIEAERDESADRRDSDLDESAPQRGPDGMFIGGVGGAEDEWAAWVPVWKKSEAGETRYALSTPAGEATLLRTGPGKSWELHFRGTTVWLGRKTSFTTATRALTRLLPGFEEQPDGVPSGRVDATDVPSMLREGANGPGAENEPPVPDGTTPGTATSIEPEPDEPPADAMRAREKAAKLRERAASRRTRSAALREAAETSKAIDTYLRGLKSQERFLEAWCWGRLFGGGVIIIGADDGLDMREPLDEANIRTIRYLQVVDRRFATIFSYDADPLSNEFGTPLLYSITSDKPGASAALRVVHRSRCIVFGGTRTTSWMRSTRNGWDAPVLERCYDQLRRYNATLAATSQLVMDASQGVLRIKDLTELIASGQGSVLQERIEVMDRTRSVLRSILLDMDEDFHREPTSFGGLGEVTNQCELALAAAIGWPTTFLFGRSPAGMNATGDSDYRTILDLIRGEQVNTLKVRLERLIKLALLAKDGPTKGVVPKNWGVVFNPLRQSTPEESAGIRKATAEADAYYQELGVPKESILRSHFRPSGFVADLEIDVEAVIAEMEEREAEGHEVSAEGTEKSASEAKAKGLEAANKAREESDQVAQLEAAIRARRLPAPEKGT